MVDAPVVQVVFLACCRARQMPMVQTLQIFVDFPHSQSLPVVVSRYCSDKLSCDSEGSADSVYRLSQWTFQSPQTGTHSCSCTWSAF